MLIKFPFADRYFCLPILFRLYISKQTVKKRGGRNHTKPELAVAVLQLLCQRHPQRHFHLLADRAYGGKSVLLKLPANCDLTSRLKLDARIYDPPPPKSKKSGRPRCAAAACGTRFCRCRLMIGLPITYCKPSSTW